MYPSVQNFAADGAELASRMGQPYEPEAPLAPEQYAAPEQAEDLDRDPFAVTPLEWESWFQGARHKSRVTFGSFSDLSGRDLNELRSASGSGEGNYGAGMNALYGAALAKIIISWEIGYRPGLAPPSGHKNPSVALDLLSGADRRRLEVHIHDQLHELIEPEKATPDSGPGSPRVPASD